MVTGARASCQGPPVLDSFCTVTLAATGEESIPWAVQRTQEIRLRLQGACYAIACVAMSGADFATRDFDPALADREQVGSGRRGCGLSPQASGVAGKSVEQKVLAATATATAREQPAIANESDKGNRVHPRNHPPLCTSLSPSCLLRIGVNSVPQFLGRTT